MSSMHDARLEGMSIVRIHSDDPFAPATAKLSIVKDGTALFLEQLSDGERRLLLLVADTARRAVILNPGMEEPLQSPGILMVDEIELHLHPTWQRTAVGALRATFPNMQLILTTHSPHVLASVPDRSVILLKDGKVLQGARVYGRDTQSVLSEVMDTPPRPDAVLKRIQELYAWMEPHPRKAKKRLKDLEAEIGADDPELVRARAMFEFMGR